MWGAAPKGWQGGDSWQKGGESWGQQGNNQQKGWQPAQSSDWWQKGAQQKGPSWQQQCKGGKDSWSQPQKGAKAVDDSWSQPRPSMVPRPSMAPSLDGSDSWSQPQKGGGDSWSQLQKGGKGSIEESWSQPHAKGGNGCYEDAWNQQKGGKGACDNSGSQSQQKGDSWGKGGKGSSSFGSQQQKGKNSWSPPSDDSWGDDPWGAQQQQAAEPAVLTVHGCQHPHIAKIIGGAFSKYGENHGKPTYKKDHIDGNLVVLIYYWDERDGANQCGWWFGPIVGGEQVWAYHSDRSSSPPRSGWQVPFGGAVDHALAVEPGGQSHQQSGSSQGQSWGGRAQPDTWNDQQMQQQIEQESYRQQQEDERRRRQEEEEMLRRQQEEERLRRQQEEEMFRQQEERRRQEEMFRQEEERRRQEQAQMLARTQAARREAEMMQEAERQRQVAERQRQEEQLWRRQREEQQRREQEALMFQQRREQEAWARQQAEQQEMQRRQEEAQRRLQQLKEEQKILKSMQEQKRQEDELKKKAELQLKQEIAQKQRGEQVASFAIRRIAMKIKLATPATFEALEKELQGELTKNIDQCGEQAFAVKQECDTALEEARGRFSKQLEEQRAELVKKEEQLRLVKEKQEKAQTMVADIQAHVEATESQLEKMKELCSGLSLSSDDSKTLSEIDAEWEKVEESKENYKATVKLCAEYIMEHTITIKDPAVPMETKQAIQKLMQRLNECQKNVDTCMADVSGQREKARRKASARERTEALELSFKKYDKDKDGVLSQKEVVDYAKGELNVKLGKTSLDYIWECLVDDDANGVTLGKLARVRSVIGVTRELARDEQRREFRMQKEAVIGGMKDALKAKVREAETVVKQIEEALKTAEDSIAQIAKKAKIMAPEQITTLANESVELLATAKHTHNEALEIMAGIDKHIEPKYEEELKQFVQCESKKVDTIMSLSQQRIDRVKMLARRHRGQAKEKELDTLEKLRKKAMRVLWHNKATKKLSNDDLFTLIDQDGDGKISEREFLAFFAAVDMGSAKDPDVKEAATEIKKPGADAESKEKDPDVKEAATEIKKPDADAESKEKETEEKTEEGEAKNANDVQNEVSVEKVPIEKANFSEEELSMLFSYFDEEKLGFLSKEVFAYLTRYCLKVVKEAALTSSLSVKDCTTLRKLEPKEVVEVIEGPLEDAGIKVKRLRVMALKDGLEGWITVLSNDGTPYVAQGGTLFKIIKPNTLTDAFEVNGEAPADASRKLHKNMVLEVREFPKKEENSGCTRMRGRVRSKEGNVGWVTTQSKEGDVLIKPI